jgi:hypothetical protein
MAWTGRFEKFLKMVFQLLRLVLEIALSGHDVLIIGVVHFLVVVIATGSDCDPSGVSLLSHLAALSAFAGGFGRRCPAVTGDNFPIA